MAAADSTTVRPCVTCQHGACAHKHRQWRYTLYRAECEHCDCQRYREPFPAFRYDGNGNKVKIERAVVPDSLPLRRRFKSVVDRRSYWREKQRESRTRRGTAAAGVVAETGD